MNDIVSASTTKKELLDDLNCWALQGHTSASCYFLLFLWSGIHDNYGQVVGRCAVG